MTESIVKELEQATGRAAGESAGEAVGSIGKAALTEAAAPAGENLAKVLEQAAMRGTKVGEVPEDSARSIQDLLKSGNNAGNIIGESGEGKALRAAELRSPYEGIGKVKTGSFNDLPDTAQNAYKGYKSNGWKGNFEGQTLGTRAGRTFNNDFGDLPKVDSKGNPIMYREFDVNNRIPGSNRDAERFVIGSDGSIYYTDSHYGQRISPRGLPPFTRIK